MALLAGAVIQNLRVNPRIAFKGFALSLRSMLPFFLGTGWTKLLRGEGEFSNLLSSMQSASDCLVDEVLLKPTPWVLGQMPEK